MLFVIAMHVHLIILGNSSAGDGIAVHTDTVDLAFHFSMHDLILIRLQ